MLVAPTQTAVALPPLACQVLIEEVRRRPAAKRTVVPSDAAPFRPERLDESHRDRTKRSLATTAAGTVAAMIPTQATGGVFLPSHASNARISLTRGAETAGSTHTPLQQQKQQQQHPSESQMAASGRRWAEDGSDFEPPLVLERPLPPAGLRAAVARRLVTPVAKKRRLGGRSWGGRGGAGGGGGKQAGPDLGLFRKSGRDTEPAIVVGDKSDKSKDGVMVATGADIARNRAEEGAADLPPLGATAPPSGSPHPANTSSNSAAVGADPRVPLAAKSSNGKGWMLLPRIAGNNGGLESSAGGSAVEGAGELKVRRRGAVVGSGAPWLGMNFADINDEDENVSPPSRSKE